MSEVKWWWVVNEGKLRLGGNKGNVIIEGETCPPIYPLGCWREAQHVELRNLLVLFAEQIVFVTSVRI